MRSSINSHVSQISGKFITSFKFNIPLFLIYLLVNNKNKVSDTISNEWRERINIVIYGLALGILLNCFIPESSTNHDEHDVTRNDNNNDNDNVDDMGQRLLDTP